MDKYLSKQQVKVILEQAPKGIDGGKIVDGLVARGYKLEGFNDQPEPTKPTTIEKVADFTGGKEIAQGLGQAIANPKIAKSIEQVQNQQFDIQGQLLARIKENKAIGKDTSKLEDALNTINEEIAKTGQGAENLLNQNELTNKQVVGDALQLGTTIVGAGNLSGVGTQAKAGLNAIKSGDNVLDAVKGAETVFKTGVRGKALPTAIQGVTENIGILKGSGKGFISGAKTGAMFSSATGVSQGLQEDKNAEQIAIQGLGGAIGGGILGGVLGGLVGGVSGGISGRKLNQEVIKAQEESGLRPSLSTVIKEKVKTDPTFAQTIKEAQKQGYQEKDINLLASLGDADKPTIRKMYDATIKAQSNPRQITRAADILGENATGIVKQVEAQNAKAGKLVDATAQSLKGKTFDATPLRDKVLNVLDDTGIAVNSDGSIDFSQSEFQFTPELQREIEKVIRTVPDGSDAYSAHIAKKSIDRLIDYGTKGEGLSGKAKSVVQGIRGAIDDTLDTNFNDYNKANREYKLTRDFIDEVRGIVGKKVDFSTKEGAQAFGQSFRSAFSNNKSRGATLKLIEDLQNIAKQRKLKGAEQNLLDQALYVNILEDTFGSQAATGLASEVGKGVKKVKGAIDVVRNPITGVSNAIAGAIENAQNITPEAKKEVLRRFIK